MKNLVIYIFVESDISALFLISAFERMLNLITFALSTNFILASEYRKLGTSHEILNGTKF